MSCTVSCGTTSCSSCELSSNGEDLHAALELILDKIVLGDVQYDEEAVALLSEYITQGDYASLCKLNNLFKSLEVSDRTKDFFILLKLFLKHNIIGILVCFALDHLGDSPLTNPLCFCFFYQASFTMEMRQISFNEIKLLINHVNLKLQEYLAFNPNATINKATY